MPHGCWRFRAWQDRNPDAPERWCHLRAAGEICLLSSVQVVHLLALEQGRRGSPLPLPSGHLALGSPDWLLRQPARHLRLRAQIADVCHPKQRGDRLREQHRLRAQSLHQFCRRWWQTHKHTLPRHNRCRQVQPFPQKVLRHSRLSRQRNQEGCPSSAPKFGHSSLKQEERGLTRTIFVFSTALVTQARALP